MKVFLNFIILTGLFFGLSGKIFAQVYIVYDNPKEINQSTGNTEAKIIIFSPVENLVIKHSAGNETGKYIRNENGKYRYELNHVFDVDDLEQGFCRTNVTISSSKASIGDILCILHPGKCYEITCEEKSRTLFFQDESKDNEIYPEANKASLSFISEINDLNIQIDENSVVFQGKAVNSTNIDINIKKENLLTTYELVFHTDAPEFNKLPKIVIQDSSLEELKVPLGQELIAKKKYKIRIIKRPYISNLPEPALPVKSLFLMPGIAYGNTPVYSVMAGYMDKLGAYIKLKSNFASKGNYEAGSQNDAYFNPDISSTVGRFAISAGAIGHLNTDWLWYAGIGYGSRWVQWETISSKRIEIDELSFSGVEPEIGAIFKYKNVLIGGGLSCLTGKKIAVEANLSVGLIF